MSKTDTQEVPAKFIIWDREGAGSFYEKRGALGTDLPITPGVPVEIGDKKEGQVPEDFAARLVEKCVAAYCYSTGTKIQNVTEETRDKAADKPAKNIPLPVTEVVTTEG